jgi:hypothetical protein
MLDQPLPMHLSPCGGARTRRGSVYPTSGFLAEVVARFATIGAAVLKADLPAPLADHLVVDAINTIGSGGVANAVHPTCGTLAEIVARLARIELAAAVARLCGTIANDVAIRPEGPPAIATPTVSIAPVRVAAERRGTRGVRVIAKGTAPTNPRTSPAHHRRRAASIHKSSQHDTEHDVDLTFRHAFAIYGSGGRLPGCTLTVTSMPK